jgi:hypothetical protein
MSRAGCSARKIPARTSSTSWHSPGEALSTDTARGRLLPAAIATIFVPLPRRVGPMAKSPFSRSRKSHPRMLPPDSACRVHAGMYALRQLNAGTYRPPNAPCRHESSSAVGMGNSSCRSMAQASRFRRRNKVPSPGVTRIDSSCCDFCAELQTVIEMIDLSWHSQKLSANAPLRLAAVEHSGVTLPARSNHVVKSYW